MRIYKITNKFNNKIYIGQTSKSLSDRFTQHANNQESVSALTSAIKKYGRDAFVIEEIAKAESQEQLDILERVYIETFNSLAPNGYNLKTGGLEGSRYSEESRKKMSEAKLGKTIPQEIKKKMSKSHIERHASDPELSKKRGAKYSQKYKDNKDLQQKMSSIRKKYWSNQENRICASVRAKHKMTDEHRAYIGQKVRESHRDPETIAKISRAIVNKQKRVIRSDGKVYSSIKEASKDLGIASSSIVRNIKGQYKSVKGLTFRYYEKPTIYMLIGAPGAGKSWVAKQLTDIFDYVSYDGNSKKDHLELLRKPSNKPKLYDPTFKISTFIRRNSEEFNVKLIAIQEDEATLRARVLGRGGKWTDTIMKRNEQVAKRYHKYGAGGFIGSSQEVLDYLKGQIPAGAASMPDKI